MKVLITSIGKRVALINHFKKNFKVVGVDATEDNVARNFVDSFYKIPLCNSTNYIDKLIEICYREKVNALIPLYEGEFEKLCKNKKEFEAIGTRVILSDEAVLKITKDKKKTYKWTEKEKISSPKVYSRDEIEAIITYGDIDKLPLVIKPKDGMGSSNVFIAKTMKELKFFKEYVKNSIVQEYINGLEYTVDVLTDFNGRPIYIVPRKRDEVRAGEVSKSTVVLDKEIIDLTKDILSKLNKVGNIEGPYTIQFIRNELGKLYLLEINPRLGGGVPLAFKAGSDYGYAIEKILKGKEIAYIDSLKEIKMLRYDEAVFEEISR